MTTNDTLHAKRQADAAKLAARQNDKALLADRDYWTSIQLLRATKGLSLPITRSYYLAACIAEAAKRGI